MKTHSSATVRKVSIQLTLIYVFWHATLVKGLSHTSYIRKVPSKEIGIIHVDSWSSISPGLAYGFCNDEPLTENALEITCTFGIETTSNVGSPEHIRYCDVTHPVYFDKEYGRIRGTLEHVRAMDEDKAIYSIQYGRTDKFSILHFSNCSVVPLDLGGEIAYAEAPFDGAFDVLVTREDGDYRRMVVDFEGNVIEDTREYVPNFYDDVVHSPLKERLVVQVRNSDIRLRAFDIDASEELKRYSIDETPYNPNVFSHIKDAISSTQNLLSICGLKNSTITCGQFDLNGVLKFESNISLAATSEKYLFNAFNLRGGGLILVGLRCARKMSDECVEIQDYITVTKIDDTGREVGTLHISEFLQTPLGNLHELHFFENEKNGMCLSLLDKDYHKDLSITVNVVCFNKEDFILY